MYAEQISCGLIATQYITQYVTDELAVPFFYGPQLVLCKKLIFPRESHFTSELRIIYFAGFYQLSSWQLICDHISLAWQRKLTFPS